MIDPERVLRPLREAGAAIEELETYQAPASLLAALRATWSAVDRTLRMMLRNDPAAGDDVRMAAMAPSQMTTDAVVTELRRRNLLSLPLAGQIHQLGRSIERADEATVRAADADLALDIVAALTNEVRHTGHAAPAASASHDDTPAASDDVVSYRLITVPGRRLLFLLAALLPVIGFLIYWNFARETDVDRGIAAFQAGRSGVAEQHFRAAIARDDEDVTARLYLARMLRQQGRHQEAGDLLRAAIRAEPEDAAVRRELGYLFLALGSPGSAAEQFKRAVELQPDEPLNWVGVIQALVRAQDPAAEEWRQRAPDSARALLAKPPR